MTAASSPPPRDGEVCADCLHEWLRHDEAVGGCIECRCPNPRPAAPSEPADSPTPGTDPYADCRAVCGSPAGCFPEPCRIDHPTAPSPVDTEPPALPMSEAHKQALRDQVLNARVEFHPEPPAEARQDDERLDEAAGLVAHNVSPAIGWWRSADAKGEPFDREKLTDRYRRAARDVLALAARPSADTETLRTRVYDVLFAELYPSSTASAIDTATDKVLRAVLDAR